MSNLNAKEKGMIIINSTNYYGDILVALKEHIVGMGFNVRDILKDEAGSICAKDNTVKGDVKNGTMSNEERMYAREDLRKRDNELITSEKWVVVVYTRELAGDGYGMYYLDVLRELYIKNKVKVYTLMVKQEHAVFPSRLEWLKRTELMMVSDKEHIYTFCNIMAENILKNELEKFRYKKLSQIIEGSSLIKDIYLYGCIKEYLSIDLYEFRLRVTVMRFMYMYLQSNNKNNGCNNYTDVLDMVKKVSEYVYFYSGECMPSSKYEVAVMEKCFLLAIQGMTLYNSYAI